ncbi:MAG: DUF2147 domain-containing protein [Phenylobacterium sp.]|uniref:DUF2147 domain-containing protein n=1 Tax=Phenylobacterium sp. TaxID=1871053 RepID=UPI0025F61950|nr:DUF2147 domain-containing protein [Phenylobacterium sp.]MCA3738885.1 DUF2147 domain-containing protein [Phenylobacterium sp.]MCA3753529.1 DUF2147 domain-containing protein [Phenylobacterium sp.]MCA4917108.1 DUF2147 domain-containing protein [Phenylobacterium sp.]MCA6247736.1 DUF2147 domain-containing protein [Phenylobacterium sp.]
MTPSQTAFIAATALALSASAAFASTSPVGVWYTEDKQGKVRIAPCGDKLCGVIISGRGKDGKPASDARDDANPNPALRSRPILGLQILRDFKPTGPGRWGGGKIYDPNTGRTYDSKLSLSNGGVLKVEGCVTVICVSQTWTPAD